MPRNFSRRKTSVFFDFVSNFLLFSLQLVTLFNSYVCIAFSKLSHFSSSLSFSPLVDNKYILFVKISVFSLLFNYIFSPSLSIGDHAWAGLHESQRAIAVICVIYYWYLKSFNTKFKWDQGRLQGEMGRSSKQKNCCRTCCYFP